MTIQTKCTLAICGLLIVELLPMPVSSVYSLYVVRKRPDWLPDVVDRLYADKTESDGLAAGQSISTGHDPMATRKKCTVILTVLFLVDLLIPVIVPTSLFVVRRRPLWFKNLVAKLYSDRKAASTGQADNQFEPQIDTPELLNALDKRFAELEKENLDFVKSLTHKTGINVNTVAQSPRYRNSNRVLG